MRTGCYKYDRLQQKREEFKSIDQDHEVGEKLKEIKSESLSSLCSPYLINNLLLTTSLHTLLLLGKIADFENSEKWAAHCDRLNDMFLTPFLERKDEPSRMKKKKKQKTDGSAEEGTTRIPKKSLLKSVTW